MTKEILDMEYGIVANLKINNSLEEDENGVSSGTSLVVSKEIWNNLSSGKEGEDTFIVVFIKIIDKINSEIKLKYNIQNEEYKLMNAVILNQNLGNKLAQKDCVLIKSNNCPNPEVELTSLYNPNNNSISEVKVVIWRAEMIALTEVIAEYFYVNESENKENGKIVNGTQDITRSLLKSYFIDQKQPIQQDKEYKLSNQVKKGSHIKLRVLYSQPTRQGYINESTSLVLTQSTEDFLTEPISPVSSEYSMNSISFDKGHKDFLELKPLDFLPPAYNNSIKLNSNLRNSVPLFKDNEVHSISCIIKVLNNRNNIINIIDRIKNINIDLNNTLFVSLKTLSKFKVLSGDWVIIRLESEDQSHYRWMQVLGLKRDNLKSIDSTFQEQECTIAYVDPLLIFNILKSQDDFDVQLLKFKVYRPDKLGFNTPLIANTLNLTRVSTPVSSQRSNQLSMGHVLKDHFLNSNRLLCLNDIIAIPIDSAVNQIASKLGNTIDIHDLNTLDISNPHYKDLVYFKVTNLSSSNKPTLPNIPVDGLLIDPQITKTSQQGASHSRIPSNLIQYYNNTNSIFSNINPSNKELEHFISLTKSCLHPLSSTLNLNCSILLYGMRGTGKSEITKAAADSLGLHVFENNCYELVEESDNKTKENFSDIFQKAASYAPCILLLKRIEALVKKFASTDVTQEPWLSTMFREQMSSLIGVEKKVGYPVIIVGTCETIENFPNSIMQCFRHEIQIEAPSEDIRESLLVSLTKNTNLAPDVSLDSIATETAALVAKDLVDLVDRAGALALSRAAKIKDTNAVNDNTITKSGFQVVSQDFEEALNKSRAQYSDSIGAPKIPNVTWDDVGGLASVKGDILDTIQLPLQHPELFASGAKKRSGILLYGPPGTGKTLLAKAVATSCALNFFSVKGPELLNMYIGESEANVRRVFQKARDAKPCVIFFDELDSVAPKRGEQGDSGGVMDRIVSQLLAELDGMGDGNTVGDVFVIGATNRPDLLDPALLRPGRFDKMLYLGVPQDHPSQLNIIQALTRKFLLHPSLNLEEISEQCPFHFTGADFYALCSDAMLKAMSRTADEIEKKVQVMNQERKDDQSEITVNYYLDHIASKDEITVLVNKQDFENALNELTPSVTPSELQHYQEIRKKFASQSLNAED